MTEPSSGGMNPAIKIVLIVAGVLCLLVCGVIGVMAWFVGRGVQGYEKNAAIQSTKSQMRNIEAAINAYRLENRRLPETLDELVGEDGLLDAEEVPRDAWDNEFFYEPQGSKEYELISLGADGVEGGEGEDADIDRAALRQRNSEEE